MTCQVRASGGGGGGEAGDGTFQAEFTPLVAGEHRIHVAYEGQPVQGSPFSCKVYDVNAIKVKEAAKGVVGKPVTFLGAFLLCFCFYARLGCIST